MKIKSQITIKQSYHDHPVGSYCGICGKWKSEEHIRYGKFAGSLDLPDHYCRTCIGHASFDDVDGKPSYEYDY